jgi:dihydrofolate reductase
MANVLTGASMSLDGFIADPSGGVGPLFDWYGNGDVEFTGADPDRVFRTTAASADYTRAQWARIRAWVVGRRLFDHNNRWVGRPPVGEAVFVVTHQAPTDWEFPDAPFTFVTDGVRSAVAQAKSFAGDKDVAVNAGNIAGQALEAGLIDEVGVDLVPVVLGAGVRFFGDYAGSPLLLENPRVVQGDRVTHLHYRLR